MDTEQLSETLTKLNNTLDPKAISKMSNSETLFQLEVHGELLQSLLHSQILNVDTKKKFNLLVCVGGEEEACSVINS